MDNNACLQWALKIAEEHAGSGNTRHVEVVLEEFYKKLIELSKNVS